MQSQKAGFPLFIASLFRAKRLGSLREYDQQAAPDFLFRKTSLDADFTDRTPNQPIKPGVHAVVRPRSPYQRVVTETLTLSRAEFPALTIVADPSNSVVLNGNNRAEWSLRFCNRGEGDTEAEALSGLQGRSMSRIGAVVNLNGPGLNCITGGTGKLIAEVPADAPIVVHTSFGAVEVSDVNGPLRVTATHGRAKLLGTTGKVDATGFVVDFEGSRGAILLSAEAEINLKLNSRFDGLLSAWAQRSVRALVPKTFLTPFQAVVSRPENFVCRTDFCPNITQEKKGGLYFFTYVGDGKTPPEHVGLRSEHATIVIDTAQTTRTAQ
jgi:hypothetical protein